MYSTVSSTTYNIHSLQPVQMDCMLELCAYAKYKLDTLTACMSALYITSIARSPITVCFQSISQS